MMNKHTDQAFRQLPAGVPGAHRLFINLLAKEPVADGCSPRLNTLEAICNSQKDHGFLKLEKTS